MNGLKPLKDLLKPQKLLLYLIDNTSPNASYCIKDLVASGVGEYIDTMVYIQDLVASGVVEYIDTMVYIQDLVASGVVEYIDTMVYIQDLVASGVGGVY